MLGAGLNQRVDRPEVRGPATTMSYFSMYLISKIDRCSPNR